MINSQYDSHAPDTWYETSLPRRLACTVSSLSVVAMVVTLQMYLHSQHVEN
jgi:hypothetical protein